jgi:hypothetical protein
LAKVLKRNTTLDRLSGLVADYVSTNYRQKILDLIELARQAKNKRNENVHGVWAEMVEVDKRLYQQDVDHLGLVDREQIAIEGIVSVAFEPTASGINLQEPMDRLRLDTRRFAHALCPTFVT